MEYRTEVFTEKTRYCEKYKTGKFANFVYFCITHGKLMLFLSIQKYTKFSNFAGSHFRTFRNQTLQFYWRIYGLRRLFYFGFVKIFIFYVNLN